MRHLSTANLDELALELDKAKTAIATHEVLGIGGRALREWRAYRRAVEGAIDALSPIPTALASMTDAELLSELEAD